MDQGEEIRDWNPKNDPEEKHITQEMLMDFGEYLFMQQKDYYDSILNIMYVERHFPTGFYMQPAQLLMEKTSTSTVTNRFDMGAKVISAPRITGAEFIADQIREWKETIETKRKELQKVHRN